MHARRRSSGRRTLHESRLFTYSCRRTTTHRRRPHGTCHHHLHVHPGALGKRCQARTRAGVPSAAGTKDGQHLLVQEALPIV
jgi:hypothetical protein